jgi:hypothetical protein
MSDVTFAMSDSLACHHDKVLKHRGILPCPIPSHAIMTKYLSTEELCLVEYYNFSVSSIDTVKA